MSSSTTPPQVKPGPSLMTLVEASSRRRTDTSDATVRTRSATISVGHGASNLSSVSLPENSSWMASGIDHAKCVVVFVTKRYIDKVYQEGGAGGVVDNCQREFNYAVGRKPDKLIAVVMEDACKNQRDWAGPVGIQMGQCMYIDARADVGTDEFEEAMEKLKTAIEQVTGQPAPLTARRVKTPEMRISSAVGRLVHGRV